MVVWIDERCAYDVLGVDSGNVVKGGACFGDGVGVTLWWSDKLGVDGGDVVDGGANVRGGMILIEGRGECESEVEKEAGVDLAISLL